MNFIKKTILSIIYFITFFIAYYFIISIISSIPLFFISHNSTSDNGYWAYALILGLTISPILSFITTSKIINK